MRISDYKKSIYQDLPAREKDNKGFSFESILNYDLKLFPFRLTDKSKESIYLELSTLFAAGLDIKTALELVSEDRARKEEKEVILKVMEYLIAGDTLALSFERTKQFSPYEYFSIQIGEESSKLKEVLAKLSVFYTKRLKQRRKILGALSYPAVILITASLAVGFMLAFVVPMFKDIFNRFGAELPKMTQLIISMSNAVSEYALFVIGLVLVIVLIIKYSLRKEQLARSFSRLVVKTPLVGKLITTVHLTTFCSSMALLIGSRIPLITAIGLVQKMVDFSPIRDALEKIANKIIQGQTLTSSMSEFSIFDRKMLALIKVGEEVNKLDFFFDQLAQKYDQELEYRTTLLSTFLEPMIIILLGLVVAFILVAMYLPMFQMSSQIGG